MARRVQHIYYSTKALADAFIGRLAEFFVDAQTGELRVGDGTTAGGIPQARADAVNITTARAALWRSALQLSALAPASAHKLDATVAPTAANDTTQGYMPGSMWVNTTAGTVYICVNAATGSAAWVDFTIYATKASPTFTGQISMPVGTATAPGIAFTGDTNTGIAQIAGADTLSVITGGVERMRFANLTSYLNGCWLQITDSANTIKGMFGPTGAGTVVVGSFSNHDTELRVGNALTVMFKYVASVVNYIQLTGAATSGTPSMGFTGTDSNVGGIITTKGLGWLNLQPGGYANVAFPPITNAVNYVKVVGAITAGSPFIAFDGPDTNVGGIFYTKGAGSFNFLPGGAPALSLASVASSVNYIAGYGAITGNAPMWSVNGPDVNISFGYSTKGTGNHIFYTNGGTAQLVIQHTASATRYPTITGSAAGNPIISTNAGGLEVRAADGNTVVVGGGQTAQFPTNLQVAESTHATSRRATLNIGTGWGLLSDISGAGVRDFGIWCGALGAAVFKATAAGVMSFTRAVFAVPVNLGNVSGTLTLDLSQGNRFDFVMVGNVTLANPTNGNNGQTVILNAKQDATGGRTLSVGTWFKTKGGTGITLSTAANARDKIVLEQYSSTEIDTVIGKDYK